MDGAASEHLLTLPAGSRVLVTGAAGFIGARLIDFLLRMPGIDVVGLVHRNAGRRHSTSTCRYIEGGMLNDAAVSAATAGADYVFHCAYDPRNAESNVAGTEKLIACARQAGISRFVLVSSFAVYQPFPDDRIDETTIAGDRSIPYVDVKLRLEDLVIANSLTGELAGTIVQPAIVFGSGCWAWTKAPAELLRRGNVVLPANGLGRCNLVYIDDVVQAMLRAAVSPDAVARRFLISGAETLTWRDFYAAIAAAIGVPGPIDVAGLPGEVQALVETANRISPATWRSRLPAFIRRLVSKVVPDRATVHRPPPELRNMFTCTAQADITLAKTMLNYEPRFTLEEGLKQMRAQGDAPGAFV